MEDNQKLEYTMWDKERCAREGGVPSSICLYTRRGNLETRLELVGFCFDEYNYAVDAMYPYRLLGEEVTEYGTAVYQSIDFSEGPMLSRYEMIPGTNLRVVEIAWTEDKETLLIVAKKV